MGDRVAEVDDTVVLALRLWLHQPPDDVGHVLGPRANSHRGGLVDCPEQRVERDPPYLGHRSGGPRLVQVDMGHVGDDEVLQDVRPVLEPAEIPLVVLEPDGAGVHDARRPLVREVQSTGQVHGLVAQGELLALLPGNDVHANRLGDRVGLDPEALREVGALREDHGTLQRRELPIGELDAQTVVTRHQPVPA